MKMPSKKIILVAITCIVVIALIFISSQNKNTQTSEQTGDDSAQNAVTPQIIMSEKVKNSSDLDTDHDGLKDWEEVLWGTDPKKADTNGNGVGDAQEVVILKKSQASQQTPTTSNVFKNIDTTPNEDHTLTGDIAREAFAKYMNLKQSGATIDQALAQQVAQSILNSVNNLEINPPKFKAENLPNITNADDTATIKNYGNDIWNIMINDTPKNNSGENEYAILATAIQNEDEAELKKLDPIISGYEATIKDMLKMSVPKSAVTVHLGFLNDMNTILAVIQNMRAYFTDSARGLGAFTYYRGSVLKLKSSLDLLISYFNTKGVVYVEGEGGYKLTHSI